MRLGIRSYRAVVLLGAGATRGAFDGIGLQKIKPPLNRDFFRVASKFAAIPAGKKYGSAVSRINAFIEDEMRIRASDPHTMEQVFNVLFISKDMPSIYSKGGKPRNPGFRREIQDFVYLVAGLLRFVQGNPRHPKGIDHHARLASAIEDGDTIISLNYDTLIDDALLARGWDPRQGYGFNATQKIRYWKKHPTDPMIKGVLLLKPHGSLNWFARGSIKKYEQALSRRPPSQIESGRLPRLYLKQGYVRFFIPPLYAKFFANKFWRKLWESVFRRLQDAELLVIVGCSLVETDFHLRSIVGTALARRHKKFRKIVIVEPSESVVKALKKFLRGRGDSATVYPDFTTFVRTLPN